MQRFFLSMAAVSALFSGCNMPTKHFSAMTAAYPETRYDSADVKTYLGHAVPDPYGWLENDRSEETGRNGSHAPKCGHARLPGHANSLPPGLARATRRRSGTTRKLALPLWKGPTPTEYYNDGLQSQYVLRRYETLKYDFHAKPEVFLDPNTFSEDGTTSLGGLTSFSPDGSLVAYQISEGGSDWRKVIVMDAVSKVILEDTLVDVKFSGLSWRGNEGFYYSSYDKPKGASELSAMTNQHKLYFHALGTAQKAG